MRPRIFPDEKTACGLLEVWQASGEADDFQRLWQAIEPIVERASRQTLWRQGIRDPSAAEEAMSLVMDHLRRLPTQGVAKFDGKQTASGYIVWLSGRRCRDVVRSLRRRREVSLDDTRAEIADQSVDPGIDHVEDSDSGAVDHLKEAINALDERSRLVIERHLAGEPQAVTAKALGACEGTITRIRQRAIQRLRELLRKEDDGPIHPKPR